jgi:hypothetical protein
LIARLAGSSQEDRAVPRKSKSQDHITSSHRLATLDNVQPLLVTRTTARKMLGVASIIQMTRLEEQGTLTPIRLNKRSSVGRVYYNYAQLVALAKCPTASKDDDDTEFGQTRVRRVHKEHAEG